MIHVIQTATTGLTCNKNLSLTNWQIVLKVSLSKIKKSQLCTLIFIVACVLGAQYFICGICLVH